VSTVLDLNRSIEENFTDYIGFAIDPFDHFFHIKPRGDMKLTGDLKQYIKGGYFKKLEDEMIPRAISYALEHKRTDRYPSFPLIGYSIGVPSAKVRFNVVDNWTQQVTKAGFKNRALLSDACMLLTGLVDRVAYHRLEKNPENVNTLWVGKLLTNYTAEIKRKLGDTNTDSARVNPRIGVLLEQLNFSTSPWLQALLTMEREDDLDLLLYGAYTLADQSKEHHDLCFRALWLYSYVLQNLEIFALATFELGIEVDSSKYPFYNAEVVANYHDSLKARNSSGYTNYETVCQPLTLLPACITVCDLTGDTWDIAEAWSRLIDLKRLTSDIDESAIQNQLLAGQFAALSKEVEEALAIDNSQPQQTLHDALVLLREFESVDFNEIRHAFDGDAFQIDGAVTVMDEKIATIKVLAQHVIETNEALDGAIQKLESAAANGSLLDDAHFQKVSDLREAVKEAQQKATDTQAGYGHACTVLYERATELKEYIEIATTEPEPESTDDDPTAVDEKRLAELEKTLADAETREYKLKVRVRHLEDAVSQQPESETVSDTEICISDSHFEAIFESRSPLAGIFKAVAHKHRERCVFSSTAWKSMSNNKSFKRLGMFYRKLNTLLSAKFISDYKASGSTGAFKHFTKTELAFNESDTTMATMGDTRRFKFEDGVTRTCEYHLRLGTSGSKQYMLRVYFTIEDGVVYIGDICDHLPVSKHG
jgi:hypothetical protein